MHYIYDLLKIRYPFCKSTVKNLMKQQNIRKMTAKLIVLEGNTDLETKCIPHLL
jgi:hypothetical protein